MRGGDFPKRDDFVLLDRRWQLLAIKSRQSPISIVTKLTKKKSLSGLSAKCQELLSTTIEEQKAKDRGSARKKSDSLASRASIPFIVLVGCLFQVVTVFQNLQQYHSIDQGLSLIHI